MVQEQTGTWVRPRGQAWGNEAQRAVLHAIAEDVARRSGHRVAAIEALRSDGNLEFVAIAGSPEAREHLLGRAAPLAMDKIVAFGTPIDGWVHVPEERVDDDTREWMAQYGHTPDLPAPARPDAWRAEDRLVRLLENDAGELRATLYLDEPLNGLRPTPESIAAINAEIRVMYEAVVSIVERERFGEQVRMVSQARAAMQSVRPGLGVDEFLEEMCAAMVEAMAVDAVDVLLAGGRAPALEPHTAYLERHMRRVWLRRGHLVVERTQVWGLREDAIPTPEVIRELMEERGVGSCLMVPIGVGEDYLGTLGLGRAHGGPRWIDSEINAAAAVASDVAGMSSTPGWWNASAPQPGAARHQRLPARHGQHARPRAAQPGQRAVDAPGDGRTPGDGVRAVERLARGDGPGHPPDRGHGRGPPGPGIGQRSGPRHAGRAGRPVGGRQRQL